MEWTESSICLSLVVIMDFWLIYHMRRALIRRVYATLKEDERDGVGVVVVGQPRQGSWVGVTWELTWAGCGNTEDEYGVWLPPGCACFR
jgi:hypothetical protein